MKKNFKKKLKNAKIEIKIDQKIINITRKQVKKMGNKLKLNSRISQAICTSLKNGNYLSTSARAVGISEASVRSWIAQGSTPNAPKIFKDFVDDVERAQAEAELKSLNAIATSDDWRAHAWILEHGTNKARYKSDDIATPQVVAVNTLIESLRTRASGQIEQNSTRATKESARNSSIVYVSGGEGDEEGLDEVSGDEVR